MSSRLTIQLHISLTPHHCPVIGTAVLILRTPKLDQWKLFSSNEHATTFLVSNSASIEAANLVP